VPLLSEHGKAGPNAPHKFSSTHQSKKTHIIDEATLEALAGEDKDFLVTSSRLDQNTPGKKTLSSIPRVGRFPRHRIPWIIGKRHSNKS